MAEMVGLGLRDASPPSATRSKGERIGEGEEGVGIFKEMHEAAS